jgi:hypothetical protein
MIRNRNVLVIPHIQLCLIFITYIVHLLLQDEMISSFHMHTHYMIVVDILVYLI